VFASFGRLRVNPPRHLAVARRVAGLSVLAAHGSLGA